MNEQILSELKDVHLPAEPSWWPPAEGYYIVIAALLVILVGLMGYLFWLAKKRRFRKMWLRELENIEIRFHETKNAGQLQTDLSWLIRRLAYESARNKKAEFKIRELGPSIERVFGSSDKAKNLLALLSEDRFKPVNNVDHVKLLAAFKELSKSCRI